MTDTETAPTVLPATPGTAPRVVLPPPREGDAEKKEDTRLRLAEEEQQTKTSRETLQVLAAAQAALVKLISGVFSAVGKIIGALLDLVEAIGGKRAAKAADHAAAEFLDHVIPGDQHSPTVPATPPTAPTPQTPTSEAPKPETPKPEAPKPETPTSEAPTPETPTSGTTRPEAPTPASQTVPEPTERDPAGTTTIDIRVRLILETYAASDDERARITPAFVGLVSRGVEFMVGVEALAPGSVRALRASEPTAETAPETTPGRTPTPGPTPVAPSGDGATVPVPNPSVSEAPAR